MEGLQDLSEMSFERFKMWTTNSLKSFLHVRHKSAEGSLDDLAARAYAAWCDNVEVDSILEAKERTVLEEYTAKLVVKDTVIPDPMSIKEGWLKEKDNSGDGILHWPSVDYLDIANYIGLTQPDFIKRLQSDYKQGKCYRYFACDFVREVFYHPISCTSEFCIMKCKVVPSNRVNSKPYDVWAVITKDSTEVPGGEINSAYCSCTAGLVGTCNHAVAMLFRMEHAVRYNLTQPISTSKLCSWNVPSGSKVNTNTKRIKDIFFDKAQYMKDEENKEKLAENKRKFLDFSPSWPSKVQQLENTSSTRNQLYNLLKDDIYGSCLWEVMEGRSLSQEDSAKVNTISCPTLIDITETFLKTEDQTDIKKCSESIIFTKEQINTIKLQTVSQSQSECWFNHRIGRITASKFHRVYTRSKTLQTVDDDQIAEASQSIISEIMGYKPKVSTYATKHGLSLEPHAKRKYTAIAKKKHTKLQTSESGIVIYEKAPYLAVSPDLEVDCECCGLGLVEIKCPFSVKGEIPSSENLKYLYQITNSSNEKITTLKENSDYYFQVQGQMGVTSRKYCDFFVYTTAGFHLERIVFNEGLWIQMQTEFKWFWLNIICPELLNSNVKTRLEQTKKSAPKIGKTKSGTAANTTPNRNNELEPHFQKTTSEVKKKPTQKSKLAKKPVQNKRRSTIQKLEVYLCGKCKMPLSADPKVYDEFSIGCDKCPLWFHFKCAGILKGVNPDSFHQWFCEKCKS